MEEFRDLGMEKTEIEYGDGTKPSAQLEYSDYQKSEARIRLVDCLLEWNCRKLTFSFETLLVELKLLVTETFEFAGRQKLTKNIFRFLRLSGFDSKNQSTQNSTASF